MLTVETEGTVLITDYCNHRATGIVRYFTEQYKYDLITNEKAKLLSSLCNVINHKPTIIKYSTKELPILEDGAKQLLVTIEAFYANLLDCELGDVCYYEHSDESKFIELDMDEFHFKKLDNDKFPLWARVK